MANGASGEGDSLGDKKADNSGVSPYFQIGTNDGANNQMSQ